MLVGDRDRHLRFHLEQLVFHVEHKLFEQLFGIFGAVNQVVEVSAKQGGNTFEEGHLSNECRHNRRARRQK